MRERKIKSYVIRSGRMSSIYKNLLEDEPSPYLIPNTSTPLDFTALFPDKGPVYAEIGFGTGEFILQTARNRGKDNFIGVEVYRQGAGKLLSLLGAEKIQNVRIINGDAAEIFSTIIPTLSLSGIHIMFPDPWPKKKHHKRRLLSETFCGVLHGSLTDGGYLWIATDWEDYANQIEFIFSRLSFKRIDRDSLDAAKFFRFESKYERKALAAGRQIREFFYIKS